MSARVGRLGGRGRGRGVMERLGRRGGRGSITCEEVRGRGGEHGEGAGGEVRTTPAKDVLLGTRVGAIRQALANLNDVRLLGDVEVGAGVGEIALLPARLVAQIEGGAEDATPAEGVVGRRGREQGRTAAAPRLVAVAGRRGVRRVRRGLRTVVEGETAYAMGAQTAEKV